MEGFSFTKKTITAFLLLICSSLAAVATVYEVGPEKAHTSLGTVPWETLQAGDTVLVHHRTNAYREKFVLCRQGTAAAPITIRGVPGPNGELPVIDGNNATTRTNLNYWGENRAVIKIGGASKPADTMPRFITVENLEVRSARPPFTYTSASKGAGAYMNNAAPIWIEKGENITIRNCTLHDSGNGFFVSSSDTAVSTNILMEGCYIFGNGNTNSILEHNIYTAALGMTFQFNRLGPLRAGCNGNNLKDRSAGLVVRYNWIEGGNRQLDLVDAEDTGILRNAPQYRTTHVYGNVLFEPNADGNKQIVHYGGDSGATASYRKGTLFFHHNTVVSKRPDSTTLFRLSTNDEYADVRNNILYVSLGGSTLALADSTGTYTLSHNLIKSGWRNSFSTFAGVLTNDGSNITMSNPGFLDDANNDFRPGASSPAVNAGGPLHPALSTNHLPVKQYVKHQGNRARASIGVPDLGAFEFGSALDVWRSLHFGASATNAAVAGNNADPDGDGVRNLMEYAFSLHPLQQSNAGLPRMEMLHTNNTSQPVLTFTRISAPAGISYVVQTSSNLVHWTDGCRYSDATNILSAGETIDISPIDATNRVIRLNTPSGRFLRVNVSEE